MQFNHRMVAYTIWLIAIFHAYDAWRCGRPRGALVLAAAVTLQAALGIVTLLMQTPLLLASAHQVLAIIVLTVALVHGESLSRRSVAAKIEPVVMTQGA